MAFTLTVNGTSRTVDVDPATPLLWVLRDHLDLKGAKYGCGVGMCGACTVHIDGQAVKSCSMPISAVGTRAVTTIEALAEHPIGKRLQAAWLDVDVAQCGYCQTGQLMAATALLGKIPQPTDADIDTHMSGNLCRCATYNRIRTAIKQAAAATEKKEG
jgi:isoquinoline 1-oxidoreductase alpha subunit